MPVSFPTTHHSPSRSLIGKERGNGPDSTAVMDLLAGLLPYLPPTHPSPPARPRRHYLGPPV
ncbi:hypothetical protein E2C01_005861 [Portunus trituberculatus]|uniref:Uncharacterized protein n=1 Tax=Portunus trituberculatus TaxID=210409 RepID=A0A5B7CUP1_PORTR|nr:hypothetical protein [Portunus trituberculatus]